MSPFPAPDPLPAPVATTANIPAVASQSTPVGRNVGVGPVLSDGRVLLTYGTINGPSEGPLDIIALAPSGAVSTLLADFDTDRIDRHRILNGGAAWVPSTDPSGANPGSLATDAGGAWRTVSVIVAGLPVAEHIFDVAQESNGDLYVCGAHVPDTAFVWRSTDGGSTWTEVLAYPSGQADGVNRFYEFRRSGGALIVTVSPGIGYYVRGTNGWTATPTVVFDPEPTPRATINDQNRVSVTGRGFVRNLPNPIGNWSVSLASDGALWFTNGTSIYRDPPP